MNAWFRDAVTRFLFSLGIVLAGCNNVHEETAGFCLSGATDGPCTTVATQEPTQGTTPASEPNADTGQPTSTATGPTPSSIDASLDTELDAGLVGRPVIMDGDNRPDRPTGNGNWLPVWWNDDAGVLFSGDGSYWPWDGGMGPFPSNGGFGTCPPTAPQSTAPCTGPASCSYDGLECSCLTGIWFCSVPQQADGPTRSACPLAQPSQDSPCPGLENLLCPYPDSNCFCRAGMWRCGR